MFDKAYFEKEFPRQFEQFKKETSQEPKVVFVFGANSHIVVNEIQSLKDGWFSFWIFDGEYKSGGKSPVLMVSRYDQVRQVLFYPLRGEHGMGFRGR